MEPVNVKSINKFWNALLVSNWKTALNFLSISISEKVTWTGSDEGRQGGSQMKRKRKMISFYFLNFFVNRLYSFLPSSLLNSRLHFHVILPHLIIQILCNFTSDLLLCLRISDLKCRQKTPKQMGPWEKMFPIFLIAPSCYNKQKCEYERTFKERNCLA